MMFIAKINTDVKMVGIDLHAVDDDEAILYSKSST